jgi:4-carboxymuconolactone decarboxylase
MHISRAGKDGEVRAERPIFTGVVHSRGLVGTDVNAAFGVGLVRFSDGARTKWHTHTASQVLYITEGRGVVADRDDELHVTAGDLVQVPAGTEHWHGAEPGAEMAHLSILPPSETTVLDA